MPTSSKPRARRTSSRRKAPRRAASRVNAQARPSSTQGLSVTEIDDLRAELARLRSAAQPSRWNAPPDDVRRSVAKLVLTLVEFIRRVLERQAIRRHEQGTLTPDETESVGMALMRLEDTISEMAAAFGLDPKELNLELGPLGKLY
ncbi:MAG: gas vesicle protein K [Vicinamibacterales bacterium]